MKNGFLFLLGLLAAIGISWAGIVVGSARQLGTLAPYYDRTEGQAYPQPLAGEAAQGQLVYRDLNCAACHTQQVRRPGYGADQERGWGSRQSVARDYLYQPYVQLGESRAGPDLANVGGRKPAYEADDLLKLLYTGQGGMPRYRFLFETRRIVGERDAHALDLAGGLTPPAGHEVVPSLRARALAAYLLSLKSTYDYPEARPATPAKEGGAP